MLRLLFTAASFLQRSEATITPVPLKGSPGNSSNLGELVLTNLLLVIEIGNEYIGQFELLSLLLCFCLCWE